MSCAAARPPADCAGRCSRRWRCSRSAPSCCWRRPTRSTARSCRPSTALRDPRGAGGAERRRRRRHRRRDVRRAARSAGCSRAGRSPRRWPACPPTSPRAIVYDVEFAEQSDDVVGDNCCIRRHAQGRQRHPQRHRGRQGRRDARSSAGKTGQKFAHATVGQRAAAGGLVRRAAAPAVRDRRTQDAVGGGRRARDGQAGGPPKMTRRRRLDRLLRAAWARQYVSFSNAVKRTFKPGIVPQPDRRHRRDRAVAAGPPPDLVAGRRDGRAGDPRERDRHAAARRCRCTRPARPPTC